jgi:hypothetical protein
VSRTPTGVGVNNQQEQLPSMTSYGKDGEEKGAAITELDFTGGRVGGK